MGNLLPILCLISGGKTSGFMAIYLRLLYPNRRILFAFGNTGREREETLIFLKMIDEVWNLGIVWIEAVINPEKGKGTGYKIVNFDTASRDGEPFEDAIKKYGLPSKLFRHCTRELKEVPIHKYASDYFEREAFFDWLRSNYTSIKPYPTHEDYKLTTLYKTFKDQYKSDYLSAVGIRSDEKHRLSKKANHIFPLADMNFTKTFINDWWNAQPFNLELKESEGNCDFCFLKSKRKRVNLLKNGLNVDWWNNMEIKYGNERQPIFDVRNGESIEDLIKMASEEMNQLSFFDLDDIDFDCFCKAN
ncbi:hypothetical protein HZP39_04225 [Elizabethkingia anophelis]|nr:hypothetical protein [Elizabethkingia anophelis]MCT4239431.1 hypothetical protein [Elizabethkingia anophelis]MCT4281998.1 hypothetical protein [Elizabethkingia anophelis]MCT4292583.1 hypothetical protein [Elizabethkingia anophelis]